MSEEEIRAQIQASLAVLGIEQPTIRDKGRLMKELMPRVKERPTAPWSTGWSPNCWLKAPERKRPPWKSNENF